MKELSDKSTALEIVLQLSEMDPVIDSPFTDRKGRKMCALCGEDSAVNSENLTHSTKCPWIYAMRQRARFAREAGTPLRPPWDKTPDEQEALEHNK